MNVLWAHLYWNLKKQNSQKQWVDWWLPGVGVEGKKGRGVEMGQIGQRVQTLNLLIEIRFAAMWPWSAYKQTQWLDLENMQKALFSISIAWFYMVMSVIYDSSEVPPLLPFLSYSPL